MKKNQSAIQFITPITAIKVENYEVSSFTLYCSQLYSFKAPLTPDAPAILKAEGIPYELAEILNRRIIHAFTSQDHYNHLLALLLTPPIR